ncbi:BglG family transcription antiterminator [Virgibacillus necropolis]|uniref:BglG family transcription antiterminator n=1 Tax=Virgibacillus necropolis TaxID=163877 RepID=UPI00384D2BF5
MTLSKRSIFILNQLLNAPSHVTPEELQTKLQVSKRTVYYDVQQINDWLEDHQLDPITNHYGKGISLDEKTKKQLPRFLYEIEGRHYHLSTDERLAWITVLLLSHKKTYFANDFAETLEVSRSTVTHDIARLRKELSPLGLDVLSTKRDGYTITGSEKDKRQAFVRYYSELYTLQGWERLSSEVVESLDGPTIDNNIQVVTGTLPFLFPIVKQWVTEAEKLIHVSYTDEMHDNLAIKSVIICKRLKNGDQITLEDEEKEVLSQTEEYKVARHIANRLSIHMDIAWPEDEICFLTMNLLGAKVNTSKLPDDTVQELGQLKQVIRAMVSEFQNRAYVIFEDRSQMEEQLFIHLKPTYYRMKYGVFVENLLTPEIRQNYGEVFDITKKVVHHIEKLVGQSLNNDETAYIAMHFGGWLRKHNTEITPKKKGIVVCENGVGTSNILRSQLDTLFSSIEIVQSVSYRNYINGNFDDIDYVFSTKPIPDNPKVIPVSPILDDAEKERLFKQIQQESDQKRSYPLSPEDLIAVVQQHADIKNLEGLTFDLKQILNHNHTSVREFRKPMLNEVLSENSIQQTKKVQSWKDAIRIAAQPLKEQKYIEDTYIKAMIENVEESGPYIVIAPKIAVPHARPEAGVQKMAMSLLTIEEGVYFSDSEDHFVQMVIVLAAVDNDTHLKALSQLTELISDQNRVDEIIQATDKKTIINLINQVSI